MASIEQTGLGKPREHRRLVTSLRQRLRELTTQLSLLNQQVSGRLELRPGDIQCLDLIAGHGPLSPTALAGMAGLHPATLTGILDRLERGRWIARDRDPDDRRGVLIRSLHDRNAELLGLYAGMSSLVDRICEGYDHTELAAITRFLGQVAEAGRDAAGQLARHEENLRRDW